MPTSNISKKVAAEKAATVNLSSGLMESEQDELRQALAIAEAEKKIKAEALPEAILSNKSLILQEIKVDNLNIIRRYAELTPSMCDVRGCGFDAAREVGKDYGITDWSNLPLDQPLPGGKTVGERTIELKDYHKATAHTLNSLNDHLITEAELRRRQQGAGPVVSGAFLTGAK